VATLRLKTENPTHDHPSMIDSMCWAKFGDAGGPPGTPLRSPMDPTRAIASEPRSPAVSLSRPIPCAEPW